MDEGDAAVPVPVPGIAVAAAAEAAADVVVDSAAILRTAPGCLDWAP